MIIIYIIFPILFISLCILTINKSLGRHARKDIKVCYKFFDRANQFVTPEKPAKLPKFVTESKGIIDLGKIKTLYYVQDEGSWVVLNEEYSLSSLKNNIPPQDIILSVEGVYYLGTICKNEKSDTRFIVKINGINVRDLVEEDADVHLIGKVILKTK